MAYQVTGFCDAFSAWEWWNLTDFALKSEYLLRFKQALAESQPELALVVDYHLEQAQLLLGQTQQLQGPTGETNELYARGRGVALVIQDERSAQAQSVVVALLSAALIAGNSLIVCSDDAKLCQALAAAYLRASLPTHLIQFVARDAYQALLESDVRSVGYVGNSETETDINRQLSERSGAIVALVSESDLSACPAAHDPHLALRFITERTRTINITAVGGNASLLELGAQPH